MVQRKGTIYTPIAEGDLLEVYNVLKGVMNGLEMSGVKFKQVSSSKASSNAPKSDSVENLSVMDYLNFRISSTTFEVSPRHFVKKIISARFM